MRRQSRKQLEEEKGGRMPGKRGVHGARLLLPVLAMRAEKDEQGKLRLLYQKNYEFSYLRTLTHDLFARSRNADRDKEKDEYSYLVAVVLVLTASLECFVNDILIEHAHNAFGGDYRQIAEGFISGSLRSRILRIVPITSSCKKRLNVGHHLVGVLFELLKVRNAIAHSAEYYIDNPKWDAASSATAARTLSRRKCALYARAVDAYFAAVLSKNTVLIEGERPKPPWKHPLISDAVPERASRTTKASEPSASGYSQPADWRLKPER